MKEAYEMLSDGKEREKKVIFLEESLLETGQHE